MDISNQKRCLTGVAALLLCGAGGAALWSISGLSEATDSSRSRRPTRAASPSDSQSEVTPVTSFTSRSLRGPLYDPPPPVPNTPPPRQPVKPRTSPVVSSPKLNLSLVGTILDASNSIAIISDASGKYDFKGVGEPLDLMPQGVTIESIEAEQVTVQYQGVESTMNLDRTFKAAPRRTSRGRR